MTQNFRGIVLVCIFILPGALVQAEMRAFELPDGRTIEAEIVSSNSKLGQITLKRVDGRTVSVKPGIFVEKDQQYIREWTSSNAFLSESILRIKCDDEVVKKWKEEETRDITYTGGSIEKDFTHNVIKYENSAYTFLFKNNSDAPIQNLMLEYCIYYEQSTMVWEEKPNIELKTFHGKMDIPVVASGGEVSVQTKPVMTYEDDINPVPQLGGDQRRPGEGRVLGLHARIRIKRGREDVFREVSLPKTFSNDKYPWTTKSLPNSRKPYRR